MGSDEMDESQDQPDGTDFEDRYKPLLARRVPVDEVVPGRAYVILARKGGVGVAVAGEGGRLGYQLHRVKFDHHFLFTEWDWSEGPPFGLRSLCMRSQMPHLRGKRNCSPGSRSRKRSTGTRSRLPGKSSSASN